MSTKQEKELEPAFEPALDPMEDTDRIQRAIEKVADEETASLPPLPLSGISYDSKEDGDSASQKSPIAQPQGNPFDTARVHTWFFTFMCMNIPIIGWIYLLYLGFNKKRTDRRNFARAYLFYKLIFLLISAVILGTLIYIGLGYLDQLLAYMEML